MATVRLSCHGFRIGRLRLPPFQVSEGEAVCLHLPSSCSEEREELIRLLSEGHDAPGLDFLGSVAWADRPRGGGFLWRLRSPAIVDWLTRSGGLSRAQAFEILERWNEPPQTNIGVIQWDPRTLIALDAALRRGAEIVLLTPPEMAIAPYRLRSIWSLPTCHPMPSFTLATKSRQGVLTIGLASPALVASR